ncbi:MAG: UDP-N-acetylmuramoyl-L-alanyl-D-glutamate--2,6-diaminopimelate ligase [Gemmatimonadaceae bacterium]
MTSALRGELLRDALRNAGLLAGERGALPEVVSGVADDSREVTPGAAFVAVRGSTSDGHTYLADAARRGMAMAIVEDATGMAGPALIVRDSRRAVAVIGAAAHGFPARSLRVIAVTGTSGKTTTVSMLRHLLDGWDGAAASIGSLGVLTGGGQPLPGGQGLTTPGPIELQRVLRVLLNAGVRTVVMEASSHALDQRRVEEIAFAAGVFTNLSRDHLDYHATMPKYFQAKARLVDLLGVDGVAVANADDAIWTDLPPAPRLVRFGLASPDAEVTARAVSYAPEGSTWTLAAGEGSVEVRLPLMGDFNVSNALAAAATGWALGVPVALIAERLATLPQVPGRLERINEHPVVLRDYAHKPDAMERALSAVRPFVGHGGRLIVLFGCGGDRDRGKRPIMGGIAERKADLVILTSDNPRTEDPERILDEIERGMARQDHLRIEDRREAIARALAVARPGDVIVLAGKGHETYQIRGSTSVPFDEKEIVRELVTGGVSP